MENLASKITDSELAIMRVLWAAQNKELSLTIIRQTLENSSEWDSSTIKTLLRRLCEKGVVASDKRDIFYYHPIVSEQDYIEYTTQLLLDKVYKGSAKKLVAALYSGDKLKRDDIEELKAMFQISEVEKDE